MKFGPAAELFYLDVIHSAYVHPDHNGLFALNHGNGVIGTPLLAGRTAPAPVCIHYRLAIYYLDGQYRTNPLAGFTAPALFCLDSRYQVNDFHF